MGIVIHKFDSFFLNCEFGLIQFIFVSFCFKLQIGCLYESSNFFWTKVQKIRAIELQNWIDLQMGFNDDEIVICASGES